MKDLFFFFQAEDGIRDIGVTGVQTCALPICDHHRVVGGVEDLVVVATDDAVMVAPRNRTQEVKQLVGRLLKDGRGEADALSTVHRPWGTYRSLHNGDRVQVKHITVRPGAKLSLQMHHHRAEHSVVVQGTAKIVRGNEEMILTEDQSTYIPLDLGGA